MEESIHTRKRNNVSFTDGDLMIAEGLKEFKQDTIFELDMITVMISIGGKSALEVDGKPYSIGRKDLLICPPGVLLSDFKEGKGAALNLLCMRYSKIQRTIYNDRSIWSTMMYARNNPVFHLNDNDMALTKAYYLVIRKKMETNRDFYYNEIMQSLLQCAFYELCVIINARISPGTDDSGLSRQDLIFKQFMELLAESDCKDRSVTGFAMKLCITPKYLSAVVKNVSGRTALDMILQNATEVIRHELEYSGKSIKEIADEFDFPNISVFGKFIKSRLGRSPREYRKKVLK